MDRQEQLRRSIESSPGTATLNGRPVGAGYAAELRRRKQGSAGGRAVREVGDDGREWPSVRAAARDLRLDEKTIAKRADRGVSLRWA